MHVIHGYLIIKHFLSCYCKYRVIREHKKCIEWKDSLDCLASEMAAAHSENWRRLMFFEMRLYPPASDDMLEDMDESEDDDDIMPELE